MNKKTKFDRMTKPQQRVAIAKDVLKQIHAGRTQATKGIYLKKVGYHGRPGPGEPCVACAVGALFVSKYNLFNGKWVDEADRFNTSNLLSPYFSNKQMMNIEMAFEVTWSSEISNNEDRMIAIMQNIIDHDGTFKPGVMYEVV